MFRSLGGESIIVLKFGICMYVPTVPHSARVLENIGRGLYVVVLGHQCTWGIIYQDLEMHVPTYGRHRSSTRLYIHVSRD